MELKATSVFEFIYDNYKPNQKQVFVLEGSSGSSKTFSIIQWLTLYSQQNEYKKITCGRSKMTWTIDTIWEEFITYLTKNRYLFNQNKSRHTVHLFNNYIKFVGADDPQKFHGPRQDITWFNEAMELDQKSFNQVNMRTNDVVFLDYNPSQYNHWIYDTLLSNLTKCTGGKMKVMEVENERGRKETVEVYYKHSTFRDNPHLPSGQRAVILGYEPTKENKLNGTSSEYDWAIYGMGKVAKRQGAIFKNWIRAPFPDHLDYLYGTDWGYTHAFTVTKVAVDHEKRKIYVKSIAYEKEKTPSQQIKIITNNISTESVNVCDSAYGMMIKELRDLDYNAIAAWKPQGSVAQGLLWMLDYMIVVDDKPESDCIENELQNYLWADKKSNTPRKEFDDAIDGIRYAYVWYRMHVLQL